MNQPELTPVIIYTDGACLGNPGPGGYAAILQARGKAKELSGGYKLTTNNRMELMAVIAGLESLKKPCQVSVTTDSRYIHDAIEKRWIDSWQRKGWLTAERKPVKNQDLWQRLLPLLKTHKVKFSWVRGHTGHPENERCDELARNCAQKSGLPEDTGYRS